MKNFQFKTNGLYQDASSLCMQLQRAYPSEHYISDAIIEKVILESINIVSQIAFACARKKSEQLGHIDQAIDSVLLTASIFPLSRDLLTIEPSEQNEVMNKLRKLLNRLTDWRKECQMEIEEHEFWDMVDRLQREADAADRNVMNYEVSGVDHLLP